VLHFVDCLRCLGRHADPRMLLEGEDVSLLEHDTEIRRLEIARETSYFYVVALSNDDDVITVACERGDCAVRDMNERAGGFDDVESQRAGSGERSLGRAVRCDHQRWRRDLLDILRDGNALGFERTQDRGVVHEIAENRERAGIRVVERERNCIANAETHAEMGRADDSQALYGKVDCNPLAVKHVQRQNLPGMPVAVRVEGDIVWAEGFGWADRAGGSERHVAGFSDRSDPEPRDGLGPWH
jgi:hypothetical protein